MGWPKKNERARLFKLKGPAYLLVMASDGGMGYYFNEKYVGQFIGSSLYCYGLYDRSGWTVTRNDKGDRIFIRYHGHVQQEMGPSSHLCLPEGGIPATEATDEEVLRAYLGDEPIMGEIPEPLEDGVDLFCFRGGVPQTWGGTAKRISWEELPNGWREKFNGVIKNPLEYRGLWRMEDLRSGHAERYCKKEQLSLFRRGA
jgi:hypothetical protein